MPRQNVRLLLEYDGHALLGWQRQADLPTVQGALEAALAAILGGERPRLVCAGRTDAGVHARAQVVNFETQHPREARRYAPPSTITSPAASACTAAIWPPPPSTPASAP